MHCKSLVPPTLSDGFEDDQDGQDPGVRAWASEQRTGPALAGSCRAWGAFAHLLS